MREPGEQPACVASWDCFNGEEGKCSLQEKFKGCGICSYGLLAGHKIFAGAAMVCLLDMIKFKYVRQVFKIH